MTLPWSSPTFGGLATSTASISQKAVSKAWPRISILVTSGYDAGRTSELAPGIRFLAKPWRALDVINFVLDGVDKASRSAPEL